jgi:hypothetical protein
MRFLGTIFKIFREIVFLVFFILCNNVKKTKINTDTSTGHKIFSTCDFNFVFGSRCFCLKDNKDTEVKQEGIICRKELRKPKVRKS